MKFATVKRGEYFVKFMKWWLGIPRLQNRRQSESRLQETYCDRLKAGLLIMDLKAASDQNARADLFTRAGMTICFLATGALLIGTLAVAQPDVQGPDISIASKTTSK